MRTLALIPLALLTTACWTPGPGQLDPSRYPWDPVNLRAKATYCVVSLERPNATGITVPGDTRVVARGLVPRFEEVPPAVGGTMEMACTPPPAR
jgi:hypothetical protein